MAAPYLELMRPTNALMAGVAAVVGGLATLGLSPHWDGLALAALSAFLGVAGANALNDAVDARIDRTAHPERPVARGAVTERAARRWSILLLACAVAAAALVNVWTLVLALALLTCLLAYESVGKQRGLVGNVLVSVSTGAVFLLGALASLTPLGSWNMGVALLDDPRLLAPVVMSALAALLNLARELFKSAQDEAHDRPTRPTYAVRHGPAAARRLGTVLALSSLPIAVLPWAARWFNNAYLMGLIPLALLLSVVPFVDTARTAQRVLKVAMIAGFVPFVLAALI